MHTRTFCFIGLKMTCYNSVQVAIVKVVFSLSRVADNRISCWVRDGPKLLYMTRRHDLFYHDTELRQPKMDKGNSGLGGITFLIYCL